MEQFSFDTIKDFDNHIKLSIPGYSNLINHVVCISTYFIKDNTNVWDLGCSTGVLSELISNKNRDSKYVNYTGIDKSQNMLDLRYEWVESPSKSNMVVADLLDFDFGTVTSFATCIFTLQFIHPKNDRITILKNLRESMVEGGAVIVAEKTLSDDSFMQDIMTFSYYDFKLESFTSEEILAKQKDLRKIMSPCTEAENMSIFIKAGFDKIEQIWQSLNFKAWLLIK